MRYKRGTKADMLIQILCTVGEYPAKYTNLFYGSEPTFKRIIANMRKNKIIEKVTPIPNYPKYRFCRKSNAILEQLKQMGYEEAYEDMLKYRGNLTPTKSIRLQKQAMVMAMLLSNGIEVMSTYKKKIGNDTSAFYTVREIRQQVQEQHNQTLIDIGLDAIDEPKLFSSACGACITEDIDYIIHNIGNELAYFNPRMELNLRDFVASCTQKETDQVHDLIFLDDLELVWYMITDTDEQLRYEKKFSAHPQIPKHIRVEGTYRSMHVIPLTNDGTRQLRIILTKDYLKQFKNQDIYKDCLVDTENNRTGIDCDLVLDGDYFVLMFIDGDITRLKSFYTAAKIRGQKEKFIVMGLPYWQQFIERHMGEYCTFNTINLEAIESILEIGGAEIDEET